MYLWLWVVAVLLDMQDTIICCFLMLKGGSGQLHVYRVFFRSMLPNKAWFL
jgi:hypothetical protein